MTAERRMLQHFRLLAMLLLAASVLLIPSRAFAGGEAVSGASAPRGIAGWSAAIVLTGSMQSSIPQGSFIVTQPVAPEDLSEGDDITFMNSPSTSVTHRIVEVLSDYGSSGRYAFVTKGTDNPLPDSEPVAQENIVGRVVFHSYALGVVFSFIRENWPLLIAFALIAWGLSKAMHRILGAAAGAPPSVQIDELKELRPPDRAPEGGEEAHRYYMKERGQRAFG